jgi:hypothetical protein
MTQKSKATKETKRLPTHEKKSEGLLSDEQLDTVTAGLLPRGFIQPAILIST